MKKTILYNFLVDKENNKIHVERSFQAPVDLVWAAWTEADILDQWWAPKPWKAETKSMNFSQGGMWHYCMVGPEGERQWCLFHYQKIDPEKHFSGVDAFCDENAVENETKPRVKWHNNFIPGENNTLVDISLEFESLEDLETLIEMGFREGFTAGLENLDAYIKARANG